MSHLFGVFTWGKRKYLEEYHQKIKTLLYTIDWHQKGPFSRISTLNRPQKEEIRGAGPPPSRLTDPIQITSL